MRIRIKITEPGIGPIFNQEIKLEDLGEAAEEIDALHQSWCGCSEEIVTDRSRLAEHLGRLIRSELDAAAAALREDRRMRRAEARAKRAIERGSVSQEKAWERIHDYAWERLVSISDAHPGLVRL